jgi:hypothetical protein
MSEAADRVTGLVHSDTAGNLHIDFGFDGSDWSTAFTTTIAHPGGGTIKFSEELVSPYYRIRFVPTTNPTKFRLAARPRSAGPR